MSCQAWHEEIALLVGGDLPPAEKAKVEEHLERCPDCRALAEDLRADRRTLASLAAQEPPPGALDRIREGIGERLRHERADRLGADDAPGRGSSRKVWLALAAALFAAALGLQLWTNLPGRNVGTEPIDGPRNARDRAPTPPAGEAAGESPGPAEGPGPVTRAAERAATEPAPELNPEPSRDSSESERLATAGAPEKPIDSRPARAQPSSSDGSITIRIVSEDPDIVFYWLTDEPKESTDEATV